MTKHRWVLWSLAALLVALASGCATVRSPDPFEPVNRKVFAFHEGVDLAVLRPTAQAYMSIVPSLGGREHARQR